VYADNIFKMMNCQLLQSTHCHRHSEDRVADDDIDHIRSAEGSWEVNVSSRFYHVQFSML